MYDKLHPHHQFRPAAFLDRDGVLNVDIGYAHLPEHLIWVSGARETVLRLNRAGYLVIVLTNQGGVGLGKYTEEHVTTFHALMQDGLAAVGARVDAFYYCPFHEKAVIDSYRADDHPDRKPNPGMILRALKDWPIQKDRSFLIGDRDSDLEAARRADIPGYKFRGGDLRDLAHVLLSTHE